MTFDKLNIKEILQQYDRTRLVNKRLLQQREDEIYNLIPRIREIDTGSATSYLEVARARILGHDVAREKTNSTSTLNRQLTEEKKQLLIKAGYPEDYLEPIYTCQKCKDTGYVGTEKCSCFMDKITEALYLQSNMSDILKMENFDNFNTDFYSTDKMDGYEFSPYQNIVNVLNISKSFVAAFETKDNYRGNILIYGETGLGKTYLTNCIAKELLDKGHRVLYLSSNELFQSVLGPYLMNQKNELEDLYKYVYNCELLIIDDLGTEVTNSFTLSHFFEIINQRAKNGLSTLISTNHNLQELKKRYSERIVSRIIADYTVFHIYGDDIRYQKRLKGIN